MKTKQQGQERNIEESDYGTKIEKSLPLNSMGLFQ
jgi:hypothetical protein